MPDGRSLNVSRTELLAKLANLTPSERVRVVGLARVIRAAREQGDTRPAAVICAHLAQPARPSRPH